MGYWKIGRGVYNRLDRILIKVVFQSFSPDGDLLFALMQKVNKKIKKSSKLANVFLLSLLIF
jgi:hypothetical protein